MERDTGAVAAEGVDGVVEVGEEFWGAVPHPASTATIMAETEIQDRDFRITRPPYKPVARRYWPEICKSWNSYHRGKT
jgi:hypothetical protein